MGIGFILANRRVEFPCRMQTWPNRLCIHADACIYKIRMPQHLTISPRPSCGSAWLACWAVGSRPMPVDLSCTPLDTWQKARGRVGHGACFPTLPIYGVLYHMRLRPSVMTSYRYPPLVAAERAPRAALPPPLLRMNAGVVPFAESSLWPHWPVPWALVGGPPTLAHTHGHVWPRPNLRSASPSPTSTPWAKKMPGFSPNYLAWRRPN